MYDAVLRVGLPGLLPSLSMSSSSLLEERYISRVRMISPADDDGDASKLMWAVEAKSIQSQLFDSLKSRWQLTFVENDVRSNNNSSEGSDNMMHSNNTSCNVNFEVEIQVSNPLIGFTLDKVLEDVAKKQVEAFGGVVMRFPFQQQYSMVIGHDCIKPMKDLLLQYGELWEVGINGVHLILLEN
eukprot:CAMPEP_0172324804 /NCGR_PEP_ID=MMETSP1058-20130122/52396_1 /TAXON_ID=83371 /ORGANISM="Detonula confervacea, Strain CCMP 353" /LENGTH=183 /DNA_ID=CAMNT_0013041197 /DNA_START=224 /DNA_END=776 /DNA_ORIENTATION=-